MRRAGLAILFAFGCPGPRVPIEESQAPLASPSTSAPVASAPAEPSKPRQSAEERAINAMLERVSGLHSLPILHAVPGKVVTRDEGIALIMGKTERDLPKQVLEAQGELFAALELTPADYPFVAGMFEMVKKNVAGFYDPEDDTMYLLDDLDDESRDQTLAHELVHALQDQHFDLGKRLKYKRGRVDVLAATSCMAEGDAMSAMFDEAYGAGAARMTPELLRFTMTASVALSETGASTPRALQASLVAPYIDGFRFVRELRERGGWDEVNRVWHELPISTEQILHLGKYDAREPPIEVAEPTAAALGPGFELLDADVNGEQGVRVAFEQWTTVARAAKAADGWGGDRYGVFARNDAKGREIALAWRIRFDDDGEAEEAAKVVDKQLGACHVRDLLGPIAWRRQGPAIAIVAGPYRRVGGKAEQIQGADCALAKRWLAELMRP